MALLEIRTDDPQPAVGRNRKAVTREAYTLVEIVVVLAIMATLAAVSWPLVMRPYQRSHVQRAAVRFCEALADARTHALREGKTYEVRWQLGGGQFQVRPRQKTISFATERSLSEDPALPVPPDRNGSPSAMLAERPAPELGGEAAAVADPIGDAWQIDERMEDGIIFQDPHAAEFARLPPAEGNSATDPSPPNRGTRAAQAAAEPGLASGVAPSVEAATLGEGTSAAAPGNWSEPLVFFADGTTRNARIMLNGTDGYEATVIVRGLTGRALVGAVRAVAFPWADDVSQEETDPRDSATPDTAAEPAGSEAGNSASASAGGSR